MSSIFTTKQWPCDLHKSLMVLVSAGNHVVAMHPGIIFTGVVKTVVTQDAGVSPTCRVDVSFLATNEESKNVMGIDFDHRFVFHKAFPEHKFYLPGDAVVELLNPKKNEEHYACYTVTLKDYPGILLEHENYDGK